MDDSSSRPLVARTNDCVTIKFRITRDEEQWFLLTSDRHLDHPHSDRAAQKRHLEQARERGALVLDFGDLFDAMQNKGDRRASKEALAPFARRDDYFNALINDAAEFLAPYADMLALIATGNHEGSVLDRNGLCLNSCLVELLTIKHGAKFLHSGGYCGWVRFCCTTHANKRQSVNLYYTHGAGGGGPVTKGTIKSARRAEVLPNANIVVSGHIHEQWQLNRPRRWLTNSGKEVPDVQKHIQIPSYKMTSVGTRGRMDWEDTREMPPKVPGAWWLRFYQRNGRLKYQVVEADE